MPKPHRTVLVIGDACQSGDDYERQLRQDANVSYRVLIEQYDARVLALCRSQQIDGILIELHSPDARCFEFLGQLEEQMGEKCPPFVAIGSGDAEIAVRAFKKGAADYLIKDRMMPDDLRLAMGSAIANAESRRELQCSQGILRQDGTRVPIRSRATAGIEGSDEHGAFAVDLTPHEQAEAALREAHIQLEAALAAGSIYTWRWNIPDNLVITDRNFAHLFGVDPEGAVIGLPIEHFESAIHPEDRRECSSASSEDG